MVSWSNKEQSLLIQIVNLNNGKFWVRLIDENNFILHSSTLKL